MKAHDALLAMWPNGIPPEDFEKALRLISLSADLRTSAKLAVTPEKPARKRASHKPYAAQSISREKVAQVAALLATGPATCEDLAKTLDLNTVAVYAALHAMGAVVVRRVPRTNGSIGKGAAVYGLPQENRATGT